MASSLNSEFQATSDIFLSFMVLDTRKKFTDYLYRALIWEKFHTFRDDNEIERGENINSELREAIWNSRTSIVMLSKNYTNSKVCKFELKEILEHCRKKG